jgi:hypothetical protein
MACVPLAAAGLSGCALETGAESEEIGTNQEELSIVAGGEVGQFSHLNNVDMGSSFNKSCFLTQVGGRFVGGGEWVKAEIVGGRWMLSYASQQGGNINASAVCVAQPLTHSKTWNKGGQPVKLRNGGTCFLTRVMGKFVGGGEQVKVYQDAVGDWFVYGGTQSDGNISATAGCIANTQLGTFPVWGAAPWSLNVVLDSTPTKKACFLQQVRGALISSKEQVSVTFANSVWTMRGASAATSASKMIGATAGCVGGADAGP